MTASTVPDFVPALLAQLELEVPEQELQQLAAFTDLLLDRNRHVNLTGIREPEACWRRNIIDSLTAMAGLADIPEGGRVIDIGSGGGLPGIPLAIARPDLKFTLLDSTGKKARFCEEAAAALGLQNVVVINDRAEHVAQQPGMREAFDAAVCRAVGPMPALLEWTLPFLCLGGVLLAMKGPSVEKELEESGDALTLLGAGEVQVFDAWPADAQIHTVIVAISKERSTPAKFPRLPGIAKSSPL